MIIIFVSGVLIHKTCQKLIRIHPFNDITHNEAIKRIRDTLRTFPSTRSTDKGAPLFFDHRKL